MHQPSLKSVAKRLVFDNLTIEVEGPRLDDESATDPNDVECARVAIKDAESVATYMFTELENQFTMRTSKVSDIPWGLKFLESVRRISIVYLGEVVKEIDVAACAARIREEDKDD